MVTVDHHGRGRVNSKKFGIARGMAAYLIKVARYGGAERGRGSVGGLRGVPRGREGGAEGRKQSAMNVGR